MNRLLLECPCCGKEVDIEDRAVEKREDGLDLIVTCPHCRERFILQRVKWVKKLLKAKYAIIKDETGQKQRIKIQKS